MNQLKELFIISRPRFWMYVLGTFLVGMIAAGNPFEYSYLVTSKLVGLSLFFTLPANLFIYGVNDIYDYETDKLNKKKITYEKLLPPEEQSRLYKWILFLIMPFIPLLFFLDISTLGAIAVFVFTGLFYSALPIRAKARPPLDILFSSIIYVSPAVVGYLATGRTDPSWMAVLGGLLWASAMQTYSAVPDIEADKKANVSTLATVLGEKASLIFCLIAYITAAVIGYSFIGNLAIFLGALYAFIVVMSLFFRDRLFTYYTYFPFVNIVSGALMFFYVFFGKI